MKTPSILLLTLLAPLAAPVFAEVPSDQCDKELLAKESSSIPFNDKVCGADVWKFLGQSVSEKQWADMKDVSAQVRMLKMRSVAPVSLGRGTAPSGPTDAQLNAAAEAAKRSTANVQAGLAQARSFASNQSQNSGPTNISLGNPNVAPTGSVRAATHVNLPSQTGSLTPAGIPKHVDVFIPSPTFVPTPKQDPHAVNLGAGSNLASAANFHVSDVTAYFRGLYKPAPAASAPSLTVVPSLGVGGNSTPATTVHATDLSAYFGSLSKSAPAMAVETKLTGMSNYFGQFYKPAATASGPSPVPNLGVQPALAAQQAKVQPVALGQPVEAPQPKSALPIPSFAQPARVRQQAKVQPVNLSAPSAAPAPVGNPVAVNLGNGTVVAPVTVQKPVNVDLSGTHTTP